MANNPIRLSPSGPVIVNDDGGQLTPGNGLQMRMDETKATCGGAISFTASELGGGNLRASLPLPNPALQYACEVQINSWTETANGSPLRIQLQRASNLAADDWEDLQFDLFEAAGSGVYQMALAHQEMDSGANAATWDLTVGDPLLTVRAMVRTTEADSTATMPNFQGFIRLVELF